MEIEVQESIFNELYDSYEQKGYLSESETLDLFSEKKVTLKEIDIIMDKLINMGVIFAENRNDNHGETIDKAQIDYEEIYDEVVKISPGIEQLVEYLRRTMPPQNREWRKLIPQAKNGNSYAVDRLFDMYLRVVVRIAYNYHIEGKIDIDDAIQDGALGLMRGIRRFDPTKHNNPASYIPLWIVQYIDRSIADNGRTIRVPVHMIESINKLEYETNKYIEVYCHDPSDEEIAVEMDVSEEKIKLMKKYNCKPISLNEIIELEAEGIIREELIDLSQSPYEITSKKLLREEIVESLSVLKQREKEVILYRMGFIDNEVKTLEEIGQMFELTRERIRQIESNAILKLRRHSHKQIFNG